MDVKDFSNGFDTLLNSYNSRGSYGLTDADLRLDEFEKSQFLTKAQEEEVLSLYTGKNPYGEGYEATEELRRYLSDLVMDASLSPIVNYNDGTFDGTFDSTFQQGNSINGVSTTSQFFQLPDDLWFITYESVSIDDSSRCESTGSMEVVPVRHDEYHKLKKNPFRGANYRRALRLDLKENVVEIVCKYHIDKYYLRYLKKLKPILLINLTDGLTLNGEDTAHGSDVHESLHQRILERAVMMALRSKGISLQRSGESNGKSN